MRTLKFASLFILCATVFGAPFSAGAQQSPSSGQGAPPPPKLEKLEEGEAPAITIREPKGERTVTEKRDSSGQVTEVKVTKGKNTYSVKPNPVPSTTLPGDGQRPVTHAAQWEILEFDKNKKHKTPGVDAEEAPPPPALVPAPAPATPSSK